MSDPARRELRVLLDEGRLLAIDKPSGLASEEVAATLGGKLVHRIDKGTSGILVLAADARAVQRMQRLLREGRFEREYLFVAHGRVECGLLESALVRDRGDGLRGSSRDGAGKRASTRIEALGFDGRATRGRALLLTGRTHQIRIHLAESGHPLVGETVYVRDHLAAGLALLPARRLMLHAWRASFDHPMTKRRVVIECPPPPELLEIAAPPG